MAEGRWRCRCRGGAHGKCGTERRSAPERRSARVSRLSAARNGAATSARMARAEVPRKDARRAERGRGQIPSDETWSERRRFYVTAYVSIEKLTSVANVWFSARAHEDTQDSST